MKTTFESVVKTCEKHTLELFLEMLETVNTIQGLKEMIKHCTTHESKRLAKKFAKPYPKLNSETSIELVGREVVQYVEENLSILFRVEIEKCRGFEFYLCPEIPGTVRLFTCTKPDCKSKFRFCLSCIHKAKETRLKTNTVVASRACPTCRTSWNDKKAVYEPPSSLLNC